MAPGVDPIGEVTKHSVHTLVFRSQKRSHEMFIHDQGNLPETDKEIEAKIKKIKSRSFYSTALVQFVDREQAKKQALDARIEVSNPENVDSSTGTPGPGLGPNAGTESAANLNSASGNQLAVFTGGNQIQKMKKMSAMSMPKPNWHAPWKLYRVISGHTGWVRSVAVEPGNEWFATGSADRVIKIWDLASGKLKLSLTGHVSTVRGLVVSPRQPYLFSCGEDRQVKCWDLEYNKVIRHYHGHLSAVYDLALHPTIDVLVSCGRDSTARVWDMRTKTNIHTLSGHTSTVGTVVCQAADPQIITGSNDQTVRLWDLAAGKSMCTLTHHKKSVRAVVLHPKLYMFASASPDNIKEWKCPDGKFIQNLSGHNAIVNCMAANADGVLVSGADNGTMHFWDWKTGYNFQRLQAPVQPGSLDSEAGVFSMTFDNSGTRLITCEADKTIKVYKEDETATEESHPINWKPDILKRRKF